MRSFFVTLLALSPLVAAAPRRPCGKGTLTTETITEWVTVTGIETDGPTSTTLMLSSSTQAPPAPPAPTTTTGPGYTVSPTLVSTTTAALTTTLVPTTNVKVTTAAATTTTAATSTSAAANKVAGILAQATAVSYQIGATTQCGDSDRLIMPGMPWTVSNSMYGSSEMVGTQCTNYKGLLSSSADDGVDFVQWTSVTDVEHVADTEDDCKGYSNIGIGVNLEYPLNQIKSIPAIYQWNRTITSDFRGANIFDFITAPTKGDGTSTATSEFMLFLEIWGGQVPIGWSSGPVATLDMYGTTWKLYQGVNPGSGVTVRSMLPDTPFSGMFSGDLKVWLDAMVSQGYIEDSQYVNVGNSGTEIFYGQTTQDVITALNINI
ncbi:glycoside hydrolase family 12 protein [Xylariaceae sp. FL0255]|nr:glycoside hydrolase family 12 protein [Xylariaceae sp. FL0255]